MGTVLDDPFCDLGLMAINREFQRQWQPIRFLAPFYFFEVIMVTLINDFYVKSLRIITFFDKNLVITISFSILGIMGSVLLITF